MSSHPPKDPSKSNMLAAGFKEFIANADPRKDWTLAMNRFINTYNQEYGLIRPNSASLAANANISTVASNASTSGGFGGVANTFNNNSTSATNPFVPESTNAPAPFSFSTPHENTPNSTFKFGFPAASAPTPSTGNDIAFGVENPPTAILSGQENQDSANADDQSSIIKSADNEWKVKYSTKVHAYHHRDGVSTKFASGQILKLQEYKSDPSKKRMVMRDSVGKVTLNVAIPKGMSTDKSRHTSRDGKEVARVQVCVIRDENHGPETLTFVCSAASHDEFYGKLKEMSS